ncbi:methyltransferase, partial [Enterococcus faecalis]|uniref:methyltransferase n=1 Tax=Enterococcus faecalis TaxID=1351 RepID=UPI003D6BB21B
ALTVAKQNAQALGAGNEFYHGNGLHAVASEKIDLLISNPPYISEQEWHLMDASDRTYEPKTVLFAKNNGLALYQQLIHE